MSALTAATLLAACGDDLVTDATAPPGSADITSPVPEPGPVVHEYAAEVRATHHAEIRSPVRGVVEKVLVEEGQHVRAGQTLITLEVGTRSDALDAARAASSDADRELEAAERELRDAQLLADNGIVSEADLARSTTQVEVMRAGVEQARGAQERARAALDDGLVRAPFDGVIDRVATSGSAVSDTDVLTTLTDTREVLAYFTVSDADYRDLVQPLVTDRTGRVALRLADGARFPLPGELDATDIEVDSTARTVTCRARFPNPTGVLRHGSSGTIVFEPERRPVNLARDDQ